MNFDAVVVSDLHLGARNSRSSEFLEFLNFVRTRRLIVAGDLFESPSLKGLRPQDIEVLRALRDFPGRVQWLRGNHDPPEAWYKGLLGLPPLDEAVINVDGRRYLIYHGHGWDRSMSLPGALIATADFIYHVAQAIDPSHRLARWLKHRCKFFIKSIDRVRQRAIAEARRRRFAGVILGHSHVVEDRYADGVHYLNCGCWTEKPAAFVGIRHGRARTYQWEGLREQAQECVEIASPEIALAGV